MTRHTQLIAVTVAAMAFATGCATTGSDTTSPTPTPSATGSPSSTTGSSPSATAGPQPSPEKTSGVVNYSITGWSTTPLELGSKLGQVPSATLESVEIGKHSEGFTRISFRFRDALPSCRLAYVPEFRGTDDKVVPVAGNAKLSAVLHTAAGPMGKTVKPTGDGKPTVQAVVKYDDFEGYLAYGIGIQVAPDSDQVRPFRCGRLQHTDTTEAPFVVFVDVQD
jgi:hypothetical protein